MCRQRAVASVYGMVKGDTGDKSDNWSFRLGRLTMQPTAFRRSTRVYGGTITDPFHDTFVSGRATYDFHPRRAV